jgi:acetylornithine deacetylase
VNQETVIKAIELLKQILSIPSLSRKEDQKCDFLQSWFKDQGFKVHRKHNNIWINSFINKNLPTVLLNSHLDTVPPSADWTSDPFLPVEKDDKVYGLGSNDAGGSVVSMIFAFSELNEIKDRDYNLILALSSEEEVTGDKGISSILEDLEKLDLAIIGEPTEMKLAICERGLIVLDCYAHGKAGHAAHNNGENAILKAIRDIKVLESLKFKKSSRLLGKVGLTVTQIEGGIQHNVIPALCKFVVDIRTNEHYSNQEIVDIIRSAVTSEVIPRSLELTSSCLDPKHPFVVKATGMGIETFGSKTLSDQAVIPRPSVKIGPGSSQRSHKADEFIYINEIRESIELYIKLLMDFKFN